MRILAAMVCGFAGLLLGAFCGGVIVLVMVGAAGDELPAPLLLAVLGVPTFLFAALGGVFGFVVSSGADEFGLRPPEEVDGHATFGGGHEPSEARAASATENYGVEESGNTAENARFDEPVTPTLVDDGIFVAELVEEHPVAPPVDPSRLAQPMYPPRPPVNATPARPPRKWPGGWSIAGIVLGVLAIAPATMAAIIVSRTAVGAASLAVFSALFFLPGLLCMATALWGDFTKAKVLRAGKVGVISGLILNGGAFLAIAFAGVVALHSDVLPPGEKTREARRKLIAARDKRIERTREIRIAARPFVSPKPKPFVPTPRPGTRPGTTTPAEPRSIAVRLPLGTLKASPAFTEKANEGRKNVARGATFTTLDLVRSPAVVPPVWSQSGKQIYTVEKDGYVRRISSADLLQTHEIKLEGEINSMTLTRKGLVIARSRPGDVILLEPTSLRPLKRYMLPGVKGATGGAFSDTVYLWFNSGVRDQPPGGYLLNLETHDAFPQRNPVMGAWFMMAPAGDFLFTGDSSQIRRYGVGREELKLHQTSQRIGSNPRNIEVSPGGKYVALPSGGGNRTPRLGARRMSYGTYIFEADNLAEPVTSIVSGPYPRSVSFDPRSEVFYAQASGAPLIVFSQKGSLLRRYTDTGVRIETDRIITSPQGGQLLLMGSGRLIHVSVPPPKLPGTDVFGSRVDPPTRLDLTAPELPPIVPSSFEDASKTVMLPGVVGSVTPAGGGRYYLIYLPELGQVAVFDVNTASVLRYLEVSPPSADTADKLLIAGAAESFVTLDPDSLVANRWSLRTFEREKVETLSSISQPMSMCMGAASQGPLLVATRKGHHFFDLKTLLRVDIKSTATVPSVAPGTVVRASSNGRVFTSNAGHLRQRFALTRLEVSPEFVNSRRLNPYTSIAMPDRDGANIYSTAGVYNQRDLYRRSAAATSYSAPLSLIMPSVRGVLALQLQFPEQSRLLPEAGSAPHLAARVQLVALRGSGREPLEIGDLDEGREVLLAYNTRDLSPERLVLPFDQRFFISSPAEIYGYIPLTRDRIEVRKIDVKDLAAKKDGRFLFFTSEPPATVKAGTTLTYQAKVQSSSDEVRYMVLPRRPGMNIDRTGKLTVQVPTTAAPVDLRFTIMAMSNGATVTQMVRMRIEP